MRLSGLRYLVTVTLVWFTACSTNQLGSSDSRSSGKYYVVATQNASFYRYGPQQGTGPDQKLARNTILTLIQPSFGYCKVQLGNGEEGYVAKEDIHVASPALVAAVTAPASLTTGKPTKSHLPPNDPRLIAPPEPLPVDLPEPTPIPETLSSPTPN